MFMHKTITKTIAAVLAAVMSTSSWSAASGSVVLDPTNLVQNTLSANQSVKSVVVMYEQLKTQIQQYQAMAQNIKSMAGKAKVELQQFGFDDIKNINQAIKAYKQLGRSVQETRSIITRRLDEAKLMGTSWKDYLSYEQGRLKTNEEGAAARVQAEQEAFRRVEDDYKFARETAEKIPATEGTHAAIQQSNALLNRMVTQNADIIRTLAQANGSQKAEEMAQKAEQERATVESTDKFLQQMQGSKTDPSEAARALKRAAGK